MSLYISFPPSPHGSGADEAPRCVTAEHRTGDSGKVRIARTSDDLLMASVPGSGAGELRMYRVA